MKLHKSFSAVFRAAGRTGRKVEKRRKCSLLGRIREKSAESCVTTILTFICFPDCSVFRKDVRKAVR